MVVVYPNFHPQRAGRRRDYGPGLKPCWDTSATAMGSNPVHLWVSPARHGAVTESCSVVSSLPLSSMSKFCCNQSWQLGYQLACTCQRGTDILYNRPSSFHFQLCLLLHGPQPLPKVPLYILLAVMELFVQCFFHSDTGKL